MIDKFDQNRRNRLLARQIGLQRVALRMERRTIVGHALLGNKVEDRVAAERFAKLRHQHVHAAGRLDRDLQYHFVADRRLAWVQCRGDANRPQLADLRQTASVGRPDDW